jgi:hypothetical protein
MIIGHISIKKPLINKLLSDWLGEKDYGAMNVSPRDLNSKFLSLSKVIKYTLFFLKLLGI